ncbi:MAG TPA: hypothetical protein VK755_01275 [Candidatus Acidoferrales bacterium]|jgi:hypothetical protein|nr:hypothetical protein [Candidatus Acidoferrales bacterium]
MFISAAMMTADLALMLLINRTSGFYVANAPAYMTYTEHTHVSALGRSQDINRAVAVRVADNFAVMQDLPEGAQRTGQAFPVMAYFDPFSEFSYSYFAGLKRVDVSVRQGRPWAFPTPAPDAGVNAIVSYNSFWAAHFAPDSTDTALHIVIEPTPRVRHELYPSEVIEDPSSQLPAHIEWRGTGGDDEVLTFDYQMLEGRWVLVHATFSATQHALGTSFKAIADVRFTNIVFPAEAPDPRLAGTPAPGPSATPI